MRVTRVRRVDDGAVMKVLKTRKRVYDELLGERSGDAGQSKKGGLEGEVRFYFPLSQPLPAFLIAC